MLGNPGPILFFLSRNIALAHRRVLHGPAEKCFMFGGRGNRVCKAQNIAMRPAVTLAVLQNLVRQIFSGLACVPACSCALHCPSPSSVRPGIFQKCEEVGTHPGNVVHCRKCSMSGLKVAKTCS